MQVHASTGQALQASFHFPTVQFESWDQFAVEEVPKSRIGGFLTVLVWLATLIYLVILVVQWVRSPPIVTSNALWSIDSESYTRGPGREGPEEHIYTCKKLMFLSVHV
eukprot:scaffold100618_cov19-Tisochrysis_lutea.AAC.1